MTEPETETETLDRLEAALARIAAHAAPSVAASDMTPPRESPKQPPDPRLIEALDEMIALLRAAIQPPRQEG